ncbi:c-type cytochrome [Candidatus Pelagibacter communis]|uniref:c-type cytochrome n=1 Tax=Pelagibacter ubique TaxID=198252 RepID=UPI00092CE556|nr:cytochrome c [Candidatus Pelagibacter ubique]
MHTLVKHINSSFKIFLLSTIILLIGFNSNAEMTAEEIIKNRQALFSKNYRTAKKVKSLTSNLDFEDAVLLMNEMSENYRVLSELFPDNTKEGFDTEALPIIWEEKDKFTKLMLKASDDMTQLASIIEDADDVGGVLTKLMWSNCKACHNRYREEH